MAQGGSMPSSPWAAASPLVGVAWSVSCARQGFRACIKLDLKGRINRAGHGGGVDQGTGEGDGWNRSVHSENLHVQSKRIGASVAEYSFGIVHGCLTHRVGLKFDNSLHPDERIAPRSSPRSSHAPQPMDLYL